ncbi:hypothetical protein BJY01DRAFT_229612 [Aspergillus pseudoustus]|uniref:C2H2-type domain-containing protein n=1 Tax=Aspergillus pseudoustus TaxID=1810923 RepID=A0ABR4IFP1_9EURO
MQEPGQDNAAASSTPIHRSFLAPTQDFPRSPRHQSLQCRWEGCNSSTIFRREADILRHLKTIHVSPKAYPCPEWGCNKAFGRKDHLRAHRRKCHGQ